MNFTYENQGTHTYLVYKFAQDDVVDSMSLGMLTNNKIPGLAQALVMQFDAEKCIKYDVTAKLSAKQFFAGPVSKKRLLGVFNGIVDAMLSAEEYMIDTNTLLLDLDYIFTDVSTCDTVMVCLPAISDDMAGNNVKEFFKNIMFTTQFDQTENCDHVAKIINYLNSASALSAEEFKKVLAGVNQETPVAVVERPVQQPAQPKVAVAPKAQPSVPQAKVQQPAAAQQPVQKPAPQPMQKPVQQPAQNKPAPAQAAAQQPEQKMSWFYLMQHYTKENVAIYKAQQEAAKQKSAAPTPAAQPAAAPSFAVPGQPAQQSFAIPGQPAPAAVPKAPQKSAPQNAPALQRAAAPVSAPKPMPNPVYSAAPAPEGKAVNFGDTTILSNNAYDGTTILNETPVAQVKPYLVRVKNKERFPLEKAVCQIGSERSFADYYIGDNRAISRSHATIINRNGEFFVTDNNSTNHTYVDDKMIQSNQEVKLSHGTKLRLANEEFEFRSY